MTQFFVLKYTSTVHEIDLHTSIYRRFSKKTPKINEKYEKIKPVVAWIALTEAMFHLKKSRNQPSNICLHYWESCNSLVLVTITQDFWTLKQTTWVAKRTAFFKTKSISTDHSIIVFRARLMHLMPIYISWYDNVADVSYRQNFTNISALFTHKSCYPVLHYCFAWNVWKHKLSLCLLLLNANSLSCSTSSLLMVHNPPTTSSNG